MPERKTAHPETEKSLKTCFVRHKILRMGVLSALCILFVVFVSLLLVKNYGGLTVDRYPLFISLTVFFCFAMGFLGGWMSRLDKKEKNGTGEMLRPAGILETPEAAYARAPETVSGEVSDNPAFSRDGQKESLSVSEPEKYTMTIFGSRGSYHVSGKQFVEFGGQTTCNIIRTGNHAVIIDCGTGLYEARTFLRDCTKIDVLLSHVHYDHCLGLLDWSIFPEDAELNFYGNFRGWLGLRTINQLFAAPFWPVDPVSGKHHQIPDWGKTVYLADDISVRFFPSPHPNGAAIMHLRVGEKTICVMVDCERSDGLPFELIQGADILMYDGMYSDEEYQTKQGWGHSTWQEGCRLAKRAEVGRLIITHHNPVNSDSVLLENEGFARNIFPDTVFARSGMTIRF